MLLEQFREQKFSSAERLYTWLLTLFVGLLVLTNVITSKYIQLGGFMFTAGALTYPFTSLLLDLITEVYGKARATMAIWLGLLASVLMTGLIYLANYIPTYERSLVSQEAFEIVFGFTPGILIGSLLAYLIAQFIDIYLFYLIRRLTKGKYLWLRNNVGSLVSQLFDTAIFATVAWVIWPRIDSKHHIDPIAWDTFYLITRNEYMLKVAFSLLNIPAVYAGVYWIRNYTKEPQK